MKQKTHGLIGLLLCFVMILGLMPMTAFAEDKIPITEFSGSISLSAPVYGETISDNRPTVSTSAHVNFRNHSWQKKAGSADAWNYVNSGVFTEGTWRYTMRVVPDQNYELTYPLSVTINGVQWKVKLDSTYNWFDIISPEFTVSAPTGGPLQFIAETNASISDHLIGDTVNKDLTRYTAGGTPPYTYSKVSGPEWLSVSADGRITGTANEIQGSSTLKVTVTDANGESITAAIPVGCVRLKAGDRIEITEISGNISLPAPVYGENIRDNRPTVYTSDHVTFWNHSWQKKAGSADAWNPVNSGVFTEGTWRYSMLVDADDNYVLTDTLTVTINGEQWKVKYDYQYNLIHIFSPEFTVTAPPTLEGTATLSSAYYASPVNPNTTGLPSTGLSYKWQRSNDGTSGWKNISGAANRAYTPVEADMGKYIRVVITADGYLGSVISNAVEVKQALINFEKPVMPTLSYNSTNGLVVTNAKANQEYIVTYNSNTPSDWSSAKKPSADGSLKLTASQNTTVYVHTRVAETSYKPAGMYTDYNSIYTGTPTYLVDFSINYSKLSLKVGEVVKLTATPIPAGATAWQTTPGVQWYVNGSNAKLYKDAACTQEYNRYTDGYAESVYLKGISQSNWFTAGAERTISGYIPTNRQITVAVTDTKGNYILERLYFQDVTLAPGESVTIDIASYPYPSKVEGTMTFEPSTGNPASKLKLTALENNTKLKIEVPADAILGGYGYSVKLDGTSINKNVWTITVAKKDIPVDGVTVIPSNVTLAPGSSTTLVAVVSPSNHTATGSVVWSKVSGSASITVDPATGRVTVSASAAEGDKATMRATVGGKYGEFVVTVEKAKYSVITFNGAAYVGEGTLIEAAEEGTRINLRADPAPAGKVFDKWVCTDGGAYFDNEYSPETYFIMPDSTVIIEATYTEKAKYGVITLNGAAYVGEGTLIEAAEEGTRINLRADPAPAGKVFDKWVCTAGGAYLDNEYSPETYFIMPDSTVMIEATYKDAAAVTDITSADITVTAPVSGGKPAGAVTADVKFTVANIAWEPAADTFAPNTVYSVVVMLEAGEGYRFTSGTVFRINGSTATVVTQSAGEAKISFTFPATVSAEHVHSLTHVPATPAACTAAGNKAYYICAGCGRLFEDAAGTVETTADKVAEKATGHSYEWVTDKEPTATESGLRHEECRVCGDKKAAVEIPAAGTATDTTPQTTPVTTPATTPTTEVTGGTSTGAATGTENVPDDTQTAPPTGEKSFMWLWAVLIVVLGACAAGAAVYFSKKKKHPAK
ncbi:MAG: hypothetical protein ACI3XO_05840 [Eubacteriales bacterium]